MNVIVNSLEYSGWSYTHVCIIDGTTHTEWEAVTYLISVL